MLKDERNIEEVVTRRLVPEMHLMVYLNVGL